MSQHCLLCLAWTTCPKPGGVTPKQFKNSTMANGLFHSKPCPCVMWVIQLTVSNINQFIHQYAAFSQSMLFLIQFFFAFMISHFSVHFDSSLIFLRNCGTYKRDKFVIHFWILTKAITLLVDSFGEWPKCPCWLQLVWSGQSTSTYLQWLQRHQQYWKCRTDQHLMKF